MVTVSSNFVAPSNFNESWHIWNNGGYYMLRVYLKHFGENREA